MSKLKIKVYIIVSTMILLLATGTIIFHYLEDWSWVNSFYFTSVTVATIGYGDLVPTTALTKIITVFYAFFGIGVLFYFINAIAEKFVENRAKNVQDRIKNHNHIDKNEQYKNVKGVRKDHLKKQAYK